MFDKWEIVCYTVLVMSENAYLTKPTQHDARMEVASAERSLEFIVDNIGTEWCNNDDIQRVLSDAIKTLGNAREISRDAENAWLHRKICYTSCVMKEEIYERALDRFTGKVLTCDLCEAEDSKENEVREWGNPYDWGVICEECDCHES